MELKETMRAYYRKLDITSDWKIKDPAMRQVWEDRWNSIWSEMDEFYKKNPNMSIARLKSKQHWVMVEHCDPVIFPGNPFFFELGYMLSRSWGMCSVTPARWLEDRKQSQMKQAHPWLVDMETRFRPLFSYDGINLCSIDEPFDMDHQTLGYTELFRMGLKGIIVKAEEQSKVFSEGSAERDFCLAVVESCRALIALAHKFAHKAELMAEGCQDEKHLKMYRLIAETAKIIPENPPESFYQGLCMLIFMREATSALEHMGISQLGHIDKLLGGLYEKDIQSGLMTEEEARELLRIWMMFTDIKFNLENNPWPETSTCVELGGCDEDGKPIYNEVTRLVIEEHHKAHYINPKLNCRFFKDSPDEYLKVIARALLDGHNNFALINDDVIIDGLMKSGVALRDARRYVNGGCQETMIEGLGHTEGAGLYVSFLRIFDLFLRKDEGTDFLRPIKNAESYEDFYAQFLACVKQFFGVILDRRAYRQSFYKDTACCPIYSATQEGCVERGKDYIQGGAKYNFSTIALVGLANVVDSLNALKTLVFEEKQLSFSDMIRVLNANWEGYEPLRRQILRLPKYGHNIPQIDQMADRLVKDITGIIDQHRNERGGKYITSFFVYRYNRKFAENLRATPDGRQDFAYMAAGCSPSQMVKIADVTAPIKSMQNIDFRGCGGGIAVMDMMLPSNKQFDEDCFCALVRACSVYRCNAFQPNVVSVQDLLEAKENPQKHKNLIVRICGLSAYFVALEPEVQDEIINRNYYER